MPAVTWLLALFCAPATSRTLGTEGHTPSDQEVAAASRICPPPLRQQMAGGGRGAVRRRATDLSHSEWLLAEWVAE